MNKALYILEYEKNARWGQFKKADGKISVEAETYEEACEIALKRLPAAKGEVTEYDHRGSGYGYSDPKPRKENYQHVFRLVDCFDQNHAGYIPNTQEINVNNSNTNSSLAIAASRSSLF